MAQASSTIEVPVIPLMPEALNALAMQGPIGESIKVFFGGQRYRPIENRGLIRLVAI